MHSLCLTTLSDWSSKTFATLATNQSEAKPIRDLATNFFPRFAFTLASHWLLVTFSFDSIGCGDYNGFILTTLRQKASFNVKKKARQ